MAETAEKEKIFVEIRQSIKFLLREREQGRESFEISSFFAKKLINGILNLFDNEISEKEYKKTVMSLFGAPGTLAQPTNAPRKFTKARVSREVGKLIRQYRMRSKKQIFQKLIEQFQPAQEDIKILRDYTVESYNRQMREPLKRKIEYLVKEGTVELRRIMSILIREKYDIDQGEVKKILDTVLAAAEKVKGALRRERPSLKTGAGLAASASLKARKRLREQMQQSLVRKTRYKRQRFTRKECPAFKFSLVENVAENDMRSLIYSGEKRAANLSVKTLLTNDRITDVQVSVLKKGNKRSADINITEFQKAVAKGQAESVLQAWLKKANKQFGFVNVQELIWFLMSILNNKFGLPEGVSNYMKSRFVKHLLELDRNLTKYVIEKALENV